jgi:hypothetical protein
MPKTIVFGGREIVLRFEHRDFSLAEEKLGLNLIGPASQPFWNREGNAYKTAVLLFIGLCHAVSGLTVDQVREFITYENCGDVEELVNAAVVEAMPKRANGEEAPEQEPGPTQPDLDPTTGSGSGPSRSSTSDLQTAPSGG